MPLKPKLSDKQRETLKRLLDEECISEDLEKYVNALNELMKRLDDEKFKNASVILKSLANINRLKIFFFLARKRDVRLRVNYVTSPISASCFTPSIRDGEGGCDLRGTEEKMEVL